MAESLFRVFDEDNSGALNFFEYLQVCLSLNCWRLILFNLTPKAENVTVLDTNDDKLNWIFMAFDQDGGGFIDVNEIRDIVTCLFRWDLEWKV